MRAVHGRRGLAAAGRCAARRSAHPVDAAGAGAVRCRSDRGGRPHDECRLAAALCVGSIAVFIAAVRIRRGRGRAVSRRRRRSAQRDRRWLPVVFRAHGGGDVLQRLCSGAAADAVRPLAVESRAMRPGWRPLGWTVAALAVAGLGERWHGPIIRLGAICIVASLAALTLVMRSGPLLGDPGRGDGDGRRVRPVVRVHRTAGDRGRRGRDRARVGVGRHQQRASGGQRRRRLPGRHRRQPARPGGGHRPAGRRRPAPSGCSRWRCRSRCSARSGAWRVAGAPTTQTS